MNRNRRARGERVEGGFQQPLTSIILVEQDSGQSGLEQFVLGPSWIELNYARAHLWPSCGIQSDPQES